MRAMVLSGGGPLAVAWESGLLAGLAADVDVAGVEFILGTSAGAILGAQVAAGAEPRALVEAILAEADDIPPRGAMRFDSTAAAQLPGLFVKAHSGQAGRAEVGAQAIAAGGESEVAYVAHFAEMLGGANWHGGFGCVAVDAEDGAVRVLTRACGEPLASAVAASCCLPGMGTPVSVGGRRYIDGGFASTANADLAVGYERVLVIAFRPSGLPGERIAARLEVQLTALRERGAEVLCLMPDAASLDAIGTQTMDVRRRPAIARAGISQGRAEAGTVKVFLGA